MSTYFGRTCKPRLRSHRETWRVNETPRAKRANVSRVYVLVHGNPINDANGNSIPNVDDFFVFRRMLFEEKSERT